MSKVQPVTIESTQYINSIELSSKIPKSNKLSKGSYYIIKHLNLIKEKDCIYAKKIDNVWIKSEGLSRRYDIVFIDMLPIVKDIIQIIIYVKIKGDIKIYRLVYENIIYSPIWDRKTKE
jgi:hypothetical protein